MKNLEVKETGVADSMVKGADAASAGTRGTAAASDAPKVSIVVPAYNVERYLRPCLDSVLAQTLADIEVVCINDGSTDATLQIMEEYAARDARVRIIDKENAGYGAGVNDGFAAARGEYVAILEADDLVEPTMYETYWRTAAANGMPDLVRGNWRKFKGEGADRSFIERQVTQMKAWYGHVFDPSADPMTLRLFAINQPGIYRRAFIEDAGIRLNESPGASYQDNGLFYQLMCLAHSCYLLEERLYLLRRDNPDSSFYSKGKVFAICDEFDFIRAFMQRHPELGQTRLELAAAKRFQSYQWNMGRIAPELRPGFADRFHDDFAALEAAGELNRERFTAREWNMLQTVLASGHLYLLSYKRDAELRKERDARRRLQRGAEYRAGRKLLKLPRLVLGRPEGGQATGGAGAAGAADAAPCLTRPTGFVGAPIDWRRVPADIPEALRAWYTQKTGEKLDFDDARTYNQKLQWLKLFAATPEKTLLADKYLAREWVAERIGAEHLVGLLGVYDTADEVDFDALPESFVLKTNHGSGGVCVADNARALDRVKTRAKLATSLNSNYALHYGYEIHYMNIPPKIIAEENIDRAGTGLVDYKFNCFGGVPHSIWCSTGLTGKAKHCRNCYDTDWNLLPCLASYPNLDDGVPRPENLDEMLEIAATLSQGFAHVRVDLFNVEGHIYFGEMTFTPKSGVDTFDPPEERWAYGRLVELPEERDTALLEQIAAWRAEALEL